MGEEKKIEPESQQVTRRFIEVYWRCTVDTRPHALNSEQRLRRAGRFSPSATWPLPPLFQLENERERERDRRSQSLQYPERGPSSVNGRSPYPPAGEKMKLFKLVLRTISAQNE